MFDPPGHARHLQADPKGYWVAAGGSAISYPEDGNDLCFALEDDSFWFRHRNRVIVATLSQFKPGGTLFDVGGGNGYVALGLEQAGFPTVLIEPSRVGAENARRRGLRHVVCATTDQAGFEDGALDAVGLFDVLEHIQDDVAFLEAMRRLIHPGGRIYLTVPAFQMLWSSDDEYAGHYRRYTRKTLGRALKAAGFRVEYLTCFFWFLPLPVLLLRSVPSRLGLRGVPSHSSARREHSKRTGLVGRLVEQAMKGELAWLSRGHTIPCGGSCLAVARRAA